jgi:hypothetical protein
VALRAAGIFRNDAGVLTLASFASIAAELQKKFTNRAAAWEQRVGAEAPRAAPIAMAVVAPVVTVAAVAPVEPVLDAAPAPAAAGGEGEHLQTSLLADDDRAKPPAPQPAPYRSRRGADHRFGRSDKVKPLDDDVTVARIPCKCGATAELTESFVAYLQETFPGVDVRQQVRTMTIWCESHPAQRKELTGIRKFVTGWLTRARSDSDIQKAVSRAGASKNGFGRGGSYGDSAPAQATESPSDDFDDLEDDRHPTELHPPVDANTTSTRLTAVQAARARRSSASLPHRTAPQRRLSEQQH